MRGDVIQLLGFDGEVDKTYDYDAYGNEYERDNNDGNYFRYCGEYYDTETGFIYLRARYYDPMVGRFTSVDPAKDGLNWYSYCYNNPVKYVDPTGLCSQCNSSGVREGWYGCMDEAAYRFGQEYGGEENEYSAIIYSRVVYKYNGKNYSLMQIMGLGLEGIIASTSDFFKTATKTKEYTYGTVVKGDLDNVKPKYEVGFGKIEGVVHTHGEFSHHDVDKYISDEDKNFGKDIFNFGIKYATTYNEKDKAAYKNPAKGIKDIWIYMYLFVGDGKYSDYDTTEVLKKYQPMTEETMEINVNVFSGVIEAY